MMFVALIRSVYRRCSRWSIGQGLMRGLALLVVWMTLSPSMSAQGLQGIPANPQPDWHYRFDLFQMLLEQSGLQPITDVDEAFASPEDTAIVLLGQFNARSVSPDLQSFLSRGALLIASDSLVRLPWLFEVRPGPVSVQQDNLRYQNYPDCIEIAPLQTRDDLLQGVRRLVVNRSGWVSQLTPALGSWSILGRLPDATTPQASRGRPILARYQSDQADNAIFVLASDHSMLTNGMLWHGDNAMLAINISKSLAKNGRRRLLFMVDGRVQQSYLQGPIAKELPNGPPPLPEKLPENLPENLPPIPPLPPEAIPKLTLEEMLQVANNVVAKVEDSDLPNALLANQPRRMPEFHYQRLLWTCAGIAVLAYGIYRLLAPSRKSSAPVLPQALSAPQKSSHEDARLIPSEPRQLGQMGQLLARDCLKQMTGSNQPLIWRQLLVQTLPSLDARSHSSLANVVSVAENRVVPEMSRLELRQLLSQLDELPEQVTSVLSSNAVSSRV